MATSIDLRVQFRGQERLLRLVNACGEWHAHLLIPGKHDWLSQECPVPSSPETWLPELRVKGLNLQIERSSGKVESIATGRLLLSERACVKDGWFGVTVRSISADYHDDIGDRRGKQSLAKLKAKKKVKQPGRPNVRGTERER